MRFYHDLFWSVSLREKKHKIIDNLKKNKVQLNKYLVVLTNNEANHLEFFDSIVLKQNLPIQDDLFVVGVADGYPRALEIVEKITREVYNQTSGADIRSYLLTKQREFEEGNL